MTSVTELAQLRVDVARACRILALAGLIGDVLGHVSARVDEAHLMIRCRGPRERGLLFTTPEDIRLLDLDGAGDLDGGYARPAEFPLHAEILRARPECGAVVHAHPPDVVAADLAGVPLRPVVGAFNIPALRLAEAGIPVFGRGVLIKSAALATDMLAAMGRQPVCLLRAHGLAAAGRDVPQAVVRALNVDHLARLCLRIAQCGAVPDPLPPEDAADLPDLGAGFNDTLVWRHYVARLQHRNLDV